MSRLKCWQLWGTNEFSVRVIDSELEFLFMEFKKISYFAGMKHGFR